MTKKTKKKNETFFRTNIFPHWRICTYIHGACICVWEDREWLNNPAIIRIETLKTKLMSLNPSDATTPLLMTKKMPGCPNTPHGMYRRPLRRVNRIWRSHEPHIKETTRASLLHPLVFISPWMYGCNIVVPGEEKIVPFFATFSIEMLRFCIQS